jgi:hypothetical protein
MQTNKQHKKFLATLMIVVSIFAGSWGVLMKPKPVDAQWVVADVTLPTWDSIWDQVRPAITSTIKSFVVKFAYGDLMKWISGENGGKPAFITDFDDWLYKQADVAASSFLEQTLTTTYKTLCTGLNANLALYWKSEFDQSYYTPTCTLSKIAQRFQNPNTEWVDFQASLSDSNTDSGFLFEVFSKAQDEQDKVTYENTVKAISGQGYSSETKDPKTGKKITKTPGAQISSFVNASVNSLYAGATTSEAWQDFFGPIIDASIQGALKRGVNTFNSLNKNK